MCKKFIMLFVLLMLTACGIFGSYYEAEPVGVGKGVDELKLSACARPARPATVAPALDHPRPVERLFLLGRLAARSGQSHRNRLFPEPLCQGCPRQMEHAGASHCRNARQCCGRKADAQQAAKKLHKFMKPIHLILRIIFVR